MVKRTYENDAVFIENAKDLEFLVNDKRINWRANPSKASRRQRRYKNRLTNMVMKSFMNP
tara:strand:- start:115 stop:294 length:180 start_codon:yes stop_codon:yes gene_type:complete